ncbi:MAG: hypothetical protein Q8P41_28710 [Pseudomonadota bacterium]|nr:hypothetical protein [Pseudomonadota bacterium]
MLGDAAKRDPILQVKVLFFLAAFLSFLLSVWLWFGGQREQGIFVGMWVASLLALGALLLAGAPARPSS